MKKKFVLTLALVLMVAVTLTAAPIEVSGEFEAGYSFTFKSAGNSLEPVNYGAEGDIDAFVAFTGDFWKVSLDSGSVNFDGGMGATADIYIDKALGAQGIDMGDLSLTVTLGNMGDLEGLSAYSNSRDELVDLEMNSGFTNAYAAKLTIGYGRLVTVMVGLDPISFADQTTVPAMDSNNAMIISAKTTPVDGISAAIAYTNVSLVGVPADATYSADGAFAGSVTVDIAALAGLDFALNASVYDWYNIEKEKNNLYLEFNGGYGDFSGYTEYRIIDTQHDIIISGGYSGFENFAVGLEVAIFDLTDETGSNEIVLGGGFDYRLGGVTYNVELKYFVEAEKFMLTPTFSIAF